MTKGDAEAKLRKLIQDYRPTATDTFAQAAEHYLKLRSGKWSKKMTETTESIFKCRINPVLGSKVISELKPSDIQIFFNSFAGGSESLAKKVVTHVRGVFECLIADDVLFKNPAKAHGVGKPKTRKPSERYLELNECRLLLDAASGREYVVLRTFLSCALRPSELFALRLEDVEPGRLRIDEAAVPCEPIKETKTEDSDAYVPLSPALEAEMRAYIRTEGIEHPKEFLFPTERGTVFNHDHYLDKMLKPIAARVGLDGVNFPVLRRTVATHLQLHGPVKAAQGLLRHSDPMTTMKHYQKVMDDAVVNAAVSWDGVLNRPVN